MSTPVLLSPHESIHSFSLGCWESGFCHLPPNNLDNTSGKSHFLSRKLPLSSIKRECITHDGFGCRGNLDSKLKETIIISHKGQSWGGAYHEVADLPAQHRRLALPTSSIRGAQGFPPQGEARWRRQFHHVDRKFSLRARAALPRSPARQVSPHISLASIGSRAHSCRSSREGRGTHRAYRRQAQLLSYLAGVL